LFSQADPPGKVRHSGASGDEKEGVREDAASASGGEVLPFLKPAATSREGWEEDGNLLDSAERC